jgi:hypothetical protein
MQSGPDSDSNDPECHTVRYKLLSDLVGQHSSIEDYFASSRIILDSMQTKIDAQDTSLKHTETTVKSSLLPSTKQLSHTLQELQNATTVTSDQLWNNLITVHNVTQTDLQELKSSAILAMTAYVNNSQSLLNEESALSQSLNSRIVDSANKKVQAIAKELNQFQSKLDEALTLYVEAADNKTELLEKYAEDASHEFEQTQSIIAESPEKATELKQQFTDLLTQEMEKERENQEQSIQVQLAATNASLAAKLQLFSESSENALESETADFHNKLNITGDKFNSRQEKIHNKTVFTNEEISHLAEFSIQAAKHSSESSQKRLTGLFGDLARVGESLGNRFSNQTTELQEVSESINGDTKKFAAMLTSENSNLKATLSSLVQGAIGSTSDQIVSLIQSLASVLASLGEGDSQAKKQISEMIYSLQDTLAKKTKGSALLGSDTERLISNLEDSSDAKITEISDSFDFEMKDKAGSVLSDAMQRAVVLETKAQEAEKQRAKIKVDMEKAKAAGDIAWQSQLAEQQRIIDENQLKLNSEMTQTLNEINSNTTFVQQSSETLLNALHEAGASQSEIDAAISASQSGQNQTLIDLATKLAASDSVKLQRLTSAINENQQIISSKFQLASSDVRNQLKSALSAVGIKIEQNVNAQIRASDMEISHGKFSIEKLDKIKNSLSQTADTEISQISKKQNEIRDSVNLKFQSDALMLRGETEKKLADLSDQAIAEQQLVNKQIKQGFMKHLLDLAKTENVTDSLKQINSILSQLRDSEYRIYKSNNSTDKNTLILSESFNNSMHRVSDLSEKSLNSYAHLGETLLRELHHSNITVNQKLDKMVSRLTKALDEIRESSRRQAELLVKAIYSNETHIQEESVLLSNLTARSGNDSSESAVKSITSLVGNFTNSTLLYSERLKQIAMNSSQFDSSLVANNISKLLEKVKEIDEKYKNGSTSKTINSMLSAAMDNAVSVNATMQTALQSFQNQAVTAQQVDGFNVNIASLQADKMMKFAKNLENDAKNASDSLKGYWEGAANRSANDVNFVKTSLEVSKVQQESRIASVIQQLSETENGSSQDLSKDQNSFGVNLALVKRLVHELINLFDLYAKKQQEKFGGYELQNKQIFFALDQSIKQNSDEVKKIVSDALNELSQGISTVDSNYLKENQFEYSMNSGIDQLNANAGQFEEKSLDKIDKLKGEVSNWVKEDKKEDEEFRLNVEKIMNGLKEKIEKKSEEFLSLIK